MLHGTNLLNLPCSTPPFAVKLINKKKCKELALELAGKRSHKFTRVAPSFLEMIDRKISVWMLDYIHQLPSKGKTIK